jgi:hypothetical protein
MVVLIPKYRNIQEGYVNCTVQNHTYFFTEVSVSDICFDQNWISINIKFHKIHSAVLKLLYADRHIFWTLSCAIK